MKTLTQHTTEESSSTKENTLLVSCGMLACLIAGWLIGSLSDEVFSQSTRQNYSNDRSIMIPSVPLHGEALPTIMLSEFSVVSKK